MGAEGRVVGVDMTPEMLAQARANAEAGGYENVEFRQGLIEEMPVEHRPRTRGRTKYGIGNRLWVGILDTLAVRWMQARMVRPRIALSSDPKEGGDRS